MRIFSENFLLDADAHHARPYAFGPSMDRTAIQAARERLKESSQKKFSKKFSAQNGFSLIEVLVAIMILSVAMVTLTSSWSGSLFAYRKSEKIQLINSLLKSKMSELEIKYAEVPFDQIKETEEEKYEEFKDLRWKAETKLLTFPDLSAIMVNLGQNEETLITMIQRMTDHFSKNIKELKVTIVWTAGKNEVEFSATTYIVNYSNTLPSMGGG